MLSTLAVNEHVENVPTVIGIDLAKNVCAAYCEPVRQAGTGAAPCAARSAIGNPGTVAALHRRHGKPAWVLISGTVRRPPD